MRITYHPIGIIHTPFKQLEEMPIQPTGRASASGTAVLQPKYAEGLRDLEGFSHVILIYHLHRSRKVELTVTPFLASEPRGVFATRAPSRPNPVGLSIVPLERIEGNVLHLANLDVLDGTPLLDLKPYVPAFDAPGNVRIGWLEGREGKVRRIKSDDRFH